MCYVTDRFAHFSGRLLRVTFTVVPYRDTMYIHAIYIHEDAILKSNKDKKKKQVVAELEC